MTENKKLNSQGQTLIEAALCLSFVSLLFFGVFFFIYSLLVSQWSDFWSYRSLICMIEHKKRSPCQKDLEEKLAFVIPKNSFQVRELWIRSDKTKVKLHVHIPPFYNQLYEKQIALPLTTRASP